MRASTSRLAVAALVVLLVGVATLVRRAADPPAPTPADASGGGPVGVVDALDPTIPSPTDVASERKRIAASRVCARSGYLCEGLRERGDTRAVRWERSVGEIRIRVPRPPGLDDDIARAFQSAAAQGILAWQNSPLPLRVARSDRPGREDFTVRWVRNLTDTELGRARTEWSREGEEVGMRVLEFTLVTHAPLGPDRVLDPRAVLLTAAHEMGHALGLPHSNAERDLMYPYNTATRPTPADYLTMEALYRLENGAEIMMGR
ncbi:MAG: matrixin family metalloprotease [Longimicrobiales bacterium]|nr:matrixin family metalloprotease [Longimicrobiales bacterium]